MLGRLIELLPKKWKKVRGRSSSRNGILFIKNRIMRYSVYGE